MRRWPFDSFLFLIFFGVCFQIGGGTLSHAQNVQAEQKEGIGSVSVRNLVQVQFEIRATNRNLVIPYCRSGDDGTYVLCAIGSVMVQRFNGTKWVRIKPGYPGEVFGIEDNQWNPATIPPGKAASFYFQFDPSFYHLQRGQRFRLAVYFWGDENSMKSGDADGSFFSSAFICP